MKAFLQVLFIISVTITYSMVEFNPAQRKVVDCIKIKATVLRQHNFLNERDIKLKVPCPILVTNITHKLIFTSASVFSFQFT